MALSQSDIRDAIDHTNNEIAAEAWDQEYEPSDGDRTPEMMVGLDGTPVRDEEAWGIPNSEAFVAGPNEADEAELDGKLAERDERIKALEGELSAAREAADPHRREREAQERERATYEILQNPDRVIEGVRGLQQQIKQLHDDNVNASMAATQREFGEDFDQAFQALTSLDTSNLRDRATVQQIYASRDPGRAVVDWYERNGDRGVRLPPSLNRVTGRGSGRRTRAADDDYRTFREANSFDDQAVANSAWE